MTMRAAAAVALAIACAPVAQAGADGPVAGFDSGGEEWSDQATRTLTRWAVSGGPIASYETFVDGTSVDVSSAAELPWTFADGDHLVEVAGTDGAGAVGPRAAARVRIDTADPYLTAWSLPSHAVAGRAAEAWVDAADALSGVSAVTWEVDGAGWGAGARRTFTLGAGTHRLGATVTDRAGNATSVAGTLVVSPPAGLPPAWFPASTTGPPVSVSRPRRPSSRAARLRARAQRAGRTAVVVEGTASVAVEGRLVITLGERGVRRVERTVDLTGGRFAVRLPISRRAGSAIVVVRLVRTDGGPQEPPVRLRVDGLEDDGDARGGYALCANLKSGEQCGPGNGRRTAGGGDKVSHKGWPAITGVLWKVLDSGNHRRRGGPDNDELLGHHGSDRLWGLGGNDVLWGDWDPENNNGRQRDRLYGGAGNDWLYPSHGPSLVSGGRGNDRVWAFYGRGLIDCGPGRDTARVRQNGAFRLKGCEIVRHFCAHGSDGKGGCRKPTSARRTRPGRV